MELRENIVEYSKGNNLNHFWRLYRKHLKAKGVLYRGLLVFRMNRFAHKHGGYIGPDTIFVSEPNMPHGLHGVFISRYAVIGKNCTIYQNVTIGEVAEKAPVIGDNCLIGAGAVLLGNIKIGDSVRIGAGAVVNCDIPDNCTAVAGMPRIIVRK